MDYTTLASTESVARAAEALTANRFTPVVLQSGKEALEYIKTHIPKGASVMNGSSVTLEEIGFVEYFKGALHGWNNLHASVLAENDEQKRKDLRRHSVVSDYYLGSVHALTEDGQLIVGSNTGSQMPHLAYTSPNLILVVGTQKIVPTISAGMERLEKHVVPLENEHMKKLYGNGTAHNKTLILHGESAMTKRSVTVLLVNEKLGF